MSNTSLAREFWMFMKGPEEVLDVADHHHDGPGRRVAGVCGRVGSGTVYLYDLLGIEALLPASPDGVVGDDELLDLGRSVANLRKLGVSE